MLDDHKQSEKQREAERDRSKRARPEDESEQRYQRCVKQREREAAEAAAEVADEASRKRECRRERSALLGQLMDQAGIDLPLDERSALIERLLVDVDLSSGSVDRWLDTEGLMIHWSPCQR